MWLASARKCVQPWLYFTGRRSACLLHIEFVLQVELQYLNLLQRPWDRKKQTRRYLVTSLQMAALRKLEVRLLGTLKYAEALVLQNELVEERRAGAIPDTLLSLQHPPTYTLGKRMTTHNLKISTEDLAALGAELQFSERGGDITFHGPGQAVLYPILSLRGLGLGARRFVEGLEDVMIRASGIHGVLAQGRMKGRTGVWVGDRKIGAIGVRVSAGGITSHGLAFNISPDLTFFSHIVPCGLDMEVTSLQREVNSRSTQPSETEVTEHLIQSFIEVFGYQGVARTPP